MRQRYRETNSEATVRLVTFPEGWTVLVNSLRQVVYCHVKSGIACFQMPENPELLKDLKFENGSISVAGDSSQKTSIRLQTRLSNRLEHGKSKISRDNHHQRSSQCVENQVMVKSPSCWIDPFQMKLNKRCTTKVTLTAEPLSRDVIKLKQAALWHGGKTRIDQARGRLRRYGETTESISNSISVRRDQLIIRSSSRAHDIIANFAPAIMRIIVVRSLERVVEHARNRVQRMQAIRACVAATVVAPVETSHEERVTF